MKRPLAVLLVLGFLAPLCPAEAAVPKVVLRALEEIFHPPETAGHRALSAVPRSLERLLSMNLSNVASRASTIADCAQMLKDDPEAREGAGLTEDQVDSVLQENGAKEFFAGSLVTDFRALAYWLDTFPPEKRAVLYYALGLRYQALQPTVLLNTNQESSLAQSSEVYLVCAAQHDAEVRSYANSGLFDEPPQLGKLESVVAKLRVILAPTGLTEEDRDSAASLLPSLAFTGTASKVETRRQSRLQVYYFLFHRQVDPLRPDILEAIYKSERLLGFKDPHR